MIPLAPIQPTLSIVYILKISRKYDIFVSCIVDEVIQLAVSEGTAAQGYFLSQTCKAEPRPGYASAVLT